MRLWFHPSISPAPKAPKPQRKGGKSLPPHLTRFPLLNLSNSQRPRLSSWFRSDAPPKQSRHGTQRLRFVTACLLPLVSLSLTRRPTPKLCGAHHQGKRKGENCNIIRNQNSFKWRGGKEEKFPQKFQCIFSPQRSRIPRLPPVAAFKLEVGMACFVLLLIYF